MLQYFCNISVILCIIWMYRDRVSTSGHYVLSSELIYCGS